MRLIFFLFYIHHWLLFTVASHFLISENIYCILPPIQRTSHTLSPCKAMYFFVAKLYASVISLSSLSITNRDILFCDTRRSPPLLKLQVSKQFSETLSTDSLGSPGPVSAAPFIYTASAQRPRSRESRWNKTSSIPDETPTFPPITPKHRSCSLAAISHCSVLGCV